MRSRRLVRTLALNTPYTDTGSYLILSGTSMSAAVTAGSVATLLASEPGLTNNQIKARLMKTAKSPNTLLNNGTYVVAGYTLQNDIFTVGAGYLNLDAALADRGDNLPANLYAASPAAVLKGDRRERQTK